MPELPKSKPATTDLLLAVAFAAPFLIPMAWAPAGRGASAILLAGDTLLGGASPYGPPWFFHDPGAALLGAVVRFFAPADLGAWPAFWALWQCATATGLALLARRIAGPVAAAAAALVYGASLAAFGFEALGRPETLAALPLATALSNLFSEGRKARFAVGLALGVASVFCLAAAGAMAAVIVYHAMENRRSTARVKWGGYELAGFLVPWLVTTAMGLAGAWWSDYAAARLFAWPLLLPERAWWARLTGFGLVPVSAFMASGVVGAAVAARRDSGIEAPAVVAAAVALWVFSATRGAISPGAELLFVAPAALCAGLALQAAVRFVSARGGSRGWAVAVVIGALFASPIPEAVRQLRFVPDYLAGIDEVSYQGRFFDARTGFDSAVVIDLGHWIAGNAAPDDAVLVYGNEPGLLVWSRRRPACGFGSILPAVAERIGAAGLLDECLRATPAAVVAVQRNWRHWTADAGVRSRTKTTIPAPVSDMLARDYRLAQRLMGFDLYVRGDRMPKAVPLATLFELNTRPGRQPSSPVN